MFKIVTTEGFDVDYYKKLIRQPFEIITNKNNLSYCCIGDEGLEKVLIYGLLISVNSGELQFEYVTEYKECNGISHRLKIDYLDKEDYEIDLIPLSKD